MASENPAYVIVSGHATITGADGVKTEVGPDATVHLSAPERRELEKDGVKLISLKEHQAKASAASADLARDADRVAKLEAAVEAANERAAAVEQAAEEAEQAHSQAIADAVALAETELIKRDALIEKLRASVPEAVDAAEQEMAAELAAAEAEAAAADEAEQGDGAQDPAEADPAQA